MANESESVFFYIGEKTEGAWIEIDASMDESDILQALFDAGVIKLKVDATNGCIVSKFVEDNKLDLNEYMAVINDADRDNLNYEAVAEYIEFASSWSRSGFRDCYQGEFETEAKFAQHIMGETMEVPEHLRPYIDYEAYAKDLFSDGYYFTNGHVFRSC